MFPSNMGEWLSAEKDRARGVRCPRCGVPDPLPLVFGMPVVELGEAAARGEIALGGCLVPPDPRPEWQCRGCGLEFAEAATLNRADAQD